jgi:averantin hydroxylase
MPQTISILSGRLPTDKLELHKRYGPVVRVAPWELSYTDSAALKPIYGHHNPTTEGFSEMDKDRMEYNIAINGVWNILGAKAVEHGRYRRLLSHSFSDKGLREMQPRVQNFVDLLIKRLKETAAKGGYTDMLQWYNWTTFDLIGDLAFGTSFHCLETQSTHPWIAAVGGNVRAASIVATIKQYRLQVLLPYLVPKRLRKFREENMRLNEAQIEERIQLGAGRGDFWNTVIEKSDFEKGTGMAKNEMVANASILVLAGSETTATLLSGATYLLLKNPGVLEKLNAEVRNTFKNEAEIDFMSVGCLDYMLAVLDEAMRTYPPVPKQGNRIVPGRGAIIAGKWVPGGVRAPFLLSLCSEANKFSSRHRLKSTSTQQTTLRLTFIGPPTLFLSAGFLCLLQNS